MTIKPGESDSGRSGGRGQSTRLTAFGRPTVRRRPKGMGSEEAGASIDGADLVTTAERSPPGALSHVKRWVPLAKKSASAFLLLATHWLTSSQWHPTNQQRQNTSATTLLRARRVSVPAAHGRTPFMPVPGGLGRPPGGQDESRRVRRPAAHTLYTTYLRPPSALSHVKRWVPLAKKSASAFLLLATHWLTSSQWHPTNQQRQNTSRAPSRT